MLRTYLVADFQPWENILRFAAEIKTTISLIAIAIVALTLVLRLAGPKPSRALSKVLNLGLVLIVIVALVPFLASWYIDYENVHRKGIYRVRVTATTVAGMPSEEVKVWANLDSVPKRVDGGWELDIPSGVKTSSGTLEVYVRDNASGAFGKAVVPLDNENLSVNVPLNPANVTVRGTVTDEKQHSLSGVRIMIVGYSSEAVFTDKDGGFELQSHVSEGEQVRLHIEKPGYTVLDDYFQAGGRPISAILKKQ